MITSRFYGRRPRTYSAGCSDGGREALVEAEPYPTDFDGIIAGDPAIGAATSGFNWNQERLTIDADPYIPADKLALVDAAVLNSCDLADGVADGLIEDPRKCTFDPASLLCSSGDISNCLTQGQVASLKAVYGGATNRYGQPVHGRVTADPATLRARADFSERETNKATGLSHLIICRIRNQVR